MIQRMESVRDYAGGVSVDFADSRAFAHGRMTVNTYGVAGDDAVTLRCYAMVDLLDLLDWLKKNKPDVFQQVGLCIAEPNP